MLSAAWTESAMLPPLRRGGAVRVSGTALTRHPCSHPCLVDYLAARASRTIWPTSVGSVRPATVRALASREMTIVVGDWATLTPCVTLS